MTLNPHSPAASATAPPGAISPAGCADALDAFTAAQQRYREAEDRLGHLESGERDREAEHADQTARLDAARAGKPVPPGNPHADALNADRAHARVESEVSGSLLTEAHDRALAAAREHALEGRTMSLQRIARARLAVDAAMVTLRSADEDYARELSLMNTWQALLEGRALSYNGSGQGSFSVGNAYALACDWTQMYRPLRDRLAAVDSILARVEEPPPTPEPTPDPDALLLVHTPDHRALRQVKRGDVTKPVSTERAARA